MSYTSPELYNHYLSMGGELPYSQWASICQEFNERVMDEIILKGKEFNMGNNLSTISVGRIKRNYNNTQVDWAESNKLKQRILEAGGKLYDAKTGEGEQWIVYFTNDWYCRFYWNKGKCKVANKTAYRFRATRGKMGNKTKLKELLQEDELAYLDFRKLSE